MDNSVTKKCSNIESNNSEDKAMQVTKGSNNVFEDIGFKAEEAASLKVRADLMLDLRRFVVGQDWT